jgi:NADH-quinone oxidoreductase subunit M
MFGKNENPANQNLLDLNARELATLIPLIIVAFWIGLYPTSFTRFLERPVNKLVEAAKPEYFKTDTPRNARNLKPVNEASGDTR